MIGNEVDNHFHSMLMDAFGQTLEVAHCAQIRVHGAIIGDGIGRACPSFGDVGVRARAFRGVLQNARQPNVGDAQVFDSVEGGFVNVVESAAAILSLAAVENEVGLLVTEQSDKELIEISGKTILVLKKV